MSKELEALEIIKQALTPPTAEEICKALKDYFGFDFYYHDNIFYDNSNCRFIYPLKISGVTELQLYDGHLPLHLIEVIVKFYKGVI